MTEEVRLPGGLCIVHLKQTTVDGLVREKYAEGDASLRDIHKSDVTTHLYEGGFKIWECALDLAELVEERAAEVAGKSVLELGCGAALPAITAAKCGAARLILQDFNEPVLECFTRANLAKNGVPEERSQLLAGPWSAVPSKLPAGCADVILTSETIYNKEDYSTLLDAIEHCLNKKGGVAWLAAKLVYFGLSGSVPDFEEAVKARGGNLKITMIKKIKSSVPRVILEIKRI